MGKILSIFKDWMLPIAMLAGAMIYLIYINIPALSPAGPVLYHIVTFLFLSADMFWLSSFIAL